MLYDVVKAKSEWIFNLGIHSNLSIELSEKIRIVNGFCVISTLILVCFAFINLITGLLYPVLGLMAHILGNVVILALNKKGYYAFTFFYFYAVSFLTVYLLALATFFEGRFTETENAFYLHLCLVLLLFSGLYRRILYVLDFLALISLKYIKFSLLGREVDKLFFLTCVNVTFVTVALYLFIAAFKREIKKSKKRVEYLNAELATQNEEMIAQHDLLKEQQEMIERKQQMTRGMVDSLPVFIAMMDTEGKYKIANLQYERKFNIPISKIEGKHYTQILTQEMLAIHQDHIERGLRGEASVFEDCLETSGETPEYYTGEYTPIFDTAGQVIFLVVFAIEITHLKNIQLQLTQSNQAKDKLFSIIAHDLRSPLNSLAGLLSLVEDSHINEKEFKSLLTELSKNIDYTSQLLNNLLHWASNQMGRPSKNSQKIDIQALIKSNFNLLRKTAENKQINLLFAEEATYEVWADKDMIDLVLRNLLSNAIKFTPQGGYVKVQYTQLDTHLRIVIIDNGIGISPENLSKVFGHSMKSTIGTHKEKGSGLGLILCREFVEINQGEIGVESNGQGTTFYFTVPLYDEKSMM